jgi:protein-tyrosine phosphatase
MNKTPMPFYKKILYGWLASIVIALIMTLFTGCATRGFPPVATINNFDHVDSYVCRGAQPNQYGLEFLARIQHVTLVINLRNVGDTWDREGVICVNEGMKYAWVPLPGASAPTPQQEALVQALIANEVAHGGKVFIHCQHGCDRTGTAVACYEINRGVPNDVALKEAKFYGLSPFEPGMSDFIKKYKPSEDAMTPLNAPSTVPSRGKSL